MKIKRKNLGKMILLSSFIIFVIGVIASCGVWMYENRMVSFESKEYGIKMQYPNSYRKQKNEKRILDVKNEEKAIQIAIEARKVEKEVEDLSKILDNYEATVKAFFGDYSVAVLEKGLIQMDGKEVAKLVTTMETQKISSKNIVFLIPYDNKEVTISINGNLESMIRNEKEINQMIRTIQFL